MIAIRVIGLSSIICGCFVIIKSQSVVDEPETSNQCIWYNEEYIRQSFERACRPTQQLLMQVKHIVDSMSAQLMISNYPQSTMTEINVGEKQHLVSALTGKFMCLEA